MPNTNNILSLILLFLFTKPYDDWYFPFKLCHGPDSMYETIKDRDIIQYTQDIFNKLEKFIGNNVSKVDHSMMRFLLDTDFNILDLYSYNSGLILTTFEEEIKNRFDHYFHSKSSKKGLSEYTENMRSGVFLKTLQEFESDYLYLSTFYYTNQLKARYKEYHKRKINIGGPQNSGLFWGPSLHDYFVSKITFLMFNWRIKDRTIASAEGADEIFFGTEEDITRYVEDYVTGFENKRNEIFKEIIPIYQFKRCFGEYFSYMNKKHWDEFTQKKNVDSQNLARLLMFTFEHLLLYYKYNDPDTTMEDLMELIEKHFELLSIPKDPETIDQYRTIYSEAIKNFYAFSMSKLDSFSASRFVVKIFHKLHKSRENPYNKYNLRKFDLLDVARTDLSKTERSETITLIAFDIIYEINPESLTNDESLFIHARVYDIKNMLFLHPFHIHHLNRIRRYFYDVYEFGRNSLNIYRAMYLLFVRTFACRVTKNTKLDASPKVLDSLLREAYDPIIKENIILARILLATGAEDDYSLENLERNQHCVDKFESFLHLNKNKLFENKMKKFRSEMGFWYSFLWKDYGIYNFKLLFDKPVRSSQLMIENYFSLTQQTKARIEDSTAKDFHFQEKMV